MKAMLKFLTNIMTSIPRLNVSLAASLVIGVLLTTTLVSLSYSSRAEACRDCPFPLKTSENHWLMPNGQIEVIIVQKERHGGKIETDIELHSVENGELLAAGKVITSRGHTNVLTQLVDPKGHQVQVKVIWYDKQHDRVQIDIRCVSNTCSIDDFVH